MNMRCSASAARQRLEKFVRHFEEQLDELLNKVVRMADLAESMIDCAIKTLIARDESSCAQVFATEDRVNAMQVDVDDLAIKLTVLLQPAARDARFLFMASRIGGELERIADQAINISQNAKHVLAAPALKPMVDIPVMADIAQTMMGDAIRAMTTRDVALANRVLEEEKKVDALRDTIFRTLLTYMMANPGTIQRALSLILIARNLERIGDHATNIAEEVIYWIQGRDIRHGNGKQPSTPPINGN